MYIDVYYLYTLFIIMQATAHVNILIVDLQRNIIKKFTSDFCIFFLVALLR